MYGNPLSPAKRMPLSRTASSPQGWRPTDAYSLSLPWGLAESRIDGILERWAGDTGLSSDPRNHPCISLFEHIRLPGGFPETRFMDAVARAAAVSPPLDVLIRQEAGYADGDAEQYTVQKTPSLATFERSLLVQCPFLLESLSWIVPEEEAPPGEPQLQLPVASSDPRDHADGCVASTTGRSRNRPYPWIGSSRAPFSWNSSEEPGISVDIFRISLRKNGFVLAEYDLYLKQWLRGSESEDAGLARRTLASYRIARGYQLTRPERESRPQLYVISDLHLGHANSIPRYKRPFPWQDTDEMDAVLVANWNAVVGERDRVVFLGDLAFRTDHTFGEYLVRLNGAIEIVEGNHDPHLPAMHHALMLRYRGTRYLCIHDPEEVRIPFDGWIVHGHTHNRDLVNYPFFSPEKRRINVSAEVIGYRPLSFAELHALVLHERKTLRQRPLSATPIRPNPNDVTPHRAAIP